MARPVNLPALATWPHRRNTCWSPCERVVLRQGHGRITIVARHHPGDTVPAAVCSFSADSSTTLIAETALTFLDALTTPALLT